MFRKIIIIVGLILISSNITNADIIKKIKVGSGLSTMKLLGDNPATKPFLETDTSKPVLYGGGFDVLSPGFALQVLVELTDDGKHRIPFDIDWSFYSAGARVPVSGFWIINYWHSVQNLSLGSGYQYSFYDLDWANAKLFAGIDIRANYIHKSEFTYKDRWANRPELDTSYVINRKSNVWRLGGYARLGIEGELIGNWTINISTAIGSPNLLGRDDKRGELLTPLSVFEDKERILTVFNFALMLQYTF